MSRQPPFTYDAETIASDILRAIGRHPTESPLNADALGSAYAAYKHHDQPEIFNLIGEDAGPELSGNIEDGAPELSGYKIYRKRQKRVPQQKRAPQTGRPPRPQAGAPRPSQGLFDNFQWTNHADRTAISMQTKGFAMIEVAKAVLGVGLPSDAALDAARFISARFSVLKQQGTMPKRWQAHSFISAEMTMEKGFTVMEDLGIMQWVASGRTSIETTKFVAKDRAYHEIQRRADWLCGLPGLMDVVRQIEDGTAAGLWTRQSANTKMIKALQIACQGTNDPVPFVGLRCAAQTGSSGALRAGQSEANTAEKAARTILAYHSADIHPDPFYKPGSSPDSDHACHSGSGDIGILGAETTRCDSPYGLVNATFQWINDNLKDEIDFVIWTGDSARHDNDEDHPRTEAQVIDQNEMIVDKFVEVFGKDDNIHDDDPTNDFIVPIIPTFGNNDILPHNIFTPGPNRWTKRYSEVWDRFVPEEQRHSFERGGWFFVEVVRNKLAVFSLNTIYFFASNSAVDGCDAKSAPGYEHMEWLRVQLQLLRERGMKAIITGHVPPARTENKQSWDETCWQKYTLWMRQYRDVIVGAVYGHVNIDHFLIQDEEELTYKFLEGREVTEADEGGRMSIESKSEYLNDLRHIWGKLPTPPAGMSYLTLDDSVETDKKKKKSKKQKKREKFMRKIGGPWAERYSLALVSPSVVPNYYPTLRVVEYNITGLEAMSPSHEQDSAMADSNTEADDVAQDDDMHDLKSKKKRRKDKKKKKARKPPFKVPKAPSKSSLPGPAYSPQTLSLLSYTQYYANLTTINHNLEAGKKNPADVTKHFGFHVEYDTKNNKVAKLPDLTVRSYLDMAEKMGRKKFSLAEEEEDDADDVSVLKSKNKIWHVFVKRAFVGTKPEQELEDEFG